MKKGYKSIRIFVVLLALAAMKMGAQPLNGVYTINSAAPASATNYQSFTTFASDLNSLGVSGPVVVNVAPGSGPYNEQVTFNQITGASSNNRIVINGNNCLITYAASSGAPHTIGMNGADFFVINDLQIQGTSSSYAFPAILYSGADYNIFSRCTFSVNANVTTSNIIPFVISGSGQYYYTYGTTGNYNTVQSCTMISGYMGISVYSNYNQPYQKGNKFLNCDIRDFYVYGVYLNAYCDQMTVRGCNISCPSRTNNTTKYGMYIYGTQNSMIDGNWVHDLFSPSLISTGSSCYGIVMYYNTESSYTGMYYPSRNPNIIRNNIISDIRHNGNMYGIYALYYDGQIYNNTISLDHTGATGGTTYGIYAYGYQANYVSHVNNNIVTITRGGGSTKYCYYNGSNTSGTDLTCERNDFYILPSSNHYIGTYTGAANTLAQLQSQGVMLTGFSVNPVYTNPSAYDYHPTNTVINNTAIPMGLIFDQQGAVRNQSTPDIGALEFLTPMCNGIPSNTITGVSFSLCPGETADLGLATLIPDAGITYQWQVSNTSAVGPWTVIPGATGLFYSTPSITNTVYYSVVITCTAPGGGASTPAIQINVAGVTTNSVPYHEDFENIGRNNRLPNCSWSAPSLGSSAATYTTAQTDNRLPHSGKSFATFANSPAGMNYYYSNGIWMEPGITYSASVWYQTDLTGAGNWNSLAIMIGTAQAAASLSMIALEAPAISPVYKSVSNTFTVGAPAYYYVAIRANASSGAAQYLSWDDLDVMIPCSASPNSPTVGLTANNMTVCSGNPVSLTASGANSYTWSTGQGGSQVSATPVLNPTTYMVTGTKTLTGCSATSSVMITVKQSPKVTINTSPLVACAGQPVNMVASGAMSYVWSTQATGAIITVTPTGGNNTYAVIGTNSLNCSTTTSVQLQVRNSPTVTVFGPLTICQGETTMLTASGANTYNWVSTGSFNQSNPVALTPNATTTYSVQGTDSFGCTGVLQIQVVVDPCTGLAANATSAAISVFPNPNQGQFTVSAASEISSIQVTDVTGRIIYKSNAGNTSATVDLSQASSGVYYVTVSTASQSSVVKVVKN